MKLIWKAKEEIDIESLMMSSIEEQLKKEQASAELKAGSEIGVDDDSSSLGVNDDGVVCWRRPAA